MADNRDSGARRALPGEGTGMSGVVELAEQLAVAVKALEEIEHHPVVERNPDGDDQAAHTMQLIATEALTALRGAA